MMLNSVRLGLPDDGIDRLQHWYQKLLDLFIQLQLSERIRFRPMQIVYRYILTVHTIRLISFPVLQKIIFNFAPGLRSLI
jgi:hypothetical protein